MQVSLTTFTNFIVATPVGRIGCVRDALRQAETGYEPAQDYWRPLRKGIIEAHRSGSGKDAIKDLAEPNDAKKVANYSECVRGYLKWVGKKKIVWRGGKAQPWTRGGVTVQVNPELFVEIDGVPHVIKLWFRAEPLSKRRADPILEILRESYGREGLIVGILDVPRGKLITPTREIADIDALLEGEAAAFETIWKRLGGV